VPPKCGLLMLLLPSVDPPHAQIAIMVVVVVEGLPSSKTRKALVNMSVAVAVAALAMRSH